MNDSNISDYGASSDEDLQSLTCIDSAVFVYLSLTIAVIVVIATLFGNTLILVTLRRFSSHFKGNMFTFIGSLAVADIFMAFALMLHIVKMSSRLTGISFRIELCALKGAFGGLSSVCSGLTLMMMSLDRFCAIQFPMKHLIKTRNNSKRVKIKIVATWIVSFAVTIVPAIITSRPITKTCVYSTSYPRLFYLGLITFLTVQFLFNVILFAIVIRTMRKRGAVTKETHYSASTNMRHEHVRMDKAKLMAKVYVVFAICWGPFITFSLLIETTSSSEMKYKYNCIREYTILLGFINSGINWIVYGLANKRFRVCFKKVLHLKGLWALRHNVYSFTTTGEST